ncbi:MAG: SCP2 sterol-binding domain-containing protein [bacterium]
MKDELTLAHLNLHAVLPLLEEVVEFDSEAARIVKGWNYSIRFAVSGGPMTFLQFGNGKLKVERGKGAFPSVGFWFTSPQKLNLMFAGKGMPILWTGFWNIGVLKGFPALAKRLEYYMRPTDEMLKDKEVFDLYIKLSLYAMTSGIKAVGENDPEIKPLMAKTRSGAVQFEVMPDGPAAYVSLCNGRLEAGKGRIEKPNCFMKFKNSEILCQLIKGELDAFAALARCDITISGFIPLVDTFNAALDRVGVYLGG